MPYGVVSGLLMPRSSLRLLQQDDPHTVICLDHAIVMLDLGGHRAALAVLLTVCLCLAQRSLPLNSNSAMQPFPRVMTMDGRRDV